MNGDAQELSRESPCCVRFAQTTSFKRASLWQLGPLKAKHRLCYHLRESAGGIHSVHIMNLVVTVQHGVGDVEWN